jgi:hypothetical protein
MYQRRPKRLHARLLAAPEPNSRHCKRHRDASSGAANDERQRVVIVCLARRWRWWHHSGPLLHRRHYSRFNRAVAELRAHCRNIGRLRVASPPPSACVRGLSHKDRQAARQGPVTTFGYDVCPVLKHTPRV